MKQDELDNPMAGSFVPAGRQAGPPISCYVRTLNEERRIRDVVRAAFQVADEVVLIDSGSTDATAAIGKEEGARVIAQPWLGNGRQKRAGEEAARHDWVLDLDADEVVTPELAAEIRGVFEAGPEFHMYQVTLVIVPPFGEPWRDFKRAQRIKLYDKRHIRIPDHAAWDQFEVPRGEKAGTLRQPILHFAFTGIEHVMAKLNRVSSVRAREAKLKPLWNVSLRVIFGLPVYFLKEYIMHGLFRGGVYGFAFAGAIACGRWLRDVKMYELHMRAR